MHDTDDTAKQSRFLLLVGGVVALLLLAACLGCSPVPGLLVYVQG